jgi:hypothetical protein
MTGMEYIDGHTDKFTTEVVGTHTRCGGDLLEVVSSKVRFLLCKKCRAESFQRPAEDMVEER